MGQAFDRDGHVLGEASGDTKREVFDKLIGEFKNAHEIRIRSLDDRIRREEQGHGQAAMPKYRCHKDVWALKIIDIKRDSEKGPTDGSALLVPDDSGYAPFRVDDAYVRKHNPQIGGYYVVYADGYKSFSPAEAFESGYTRIA